MRPGRVTLTVLVAVDSIVVPNRYAAARARLADTRETRGGRESDSRIEHRRGSRVGVRVFNSGAKATCA